ncbi:hypothetical protein MMC30_001018, partial [Trapelia coarctata]|nr:hypothetical protein [Trapelia coarctata]
KRIFLLGPSHHVYITNATISQCTHYKTPMGDLTLDTATIAELHGTGKFGKMTKGVDEEEHSLEMQLPYIHKLLSITFEKSADFPPLIPIMVGNTSHAKEREYGAILAPYLEDETSIFIASSDFCHWGTRFGYTYYLPSPETDTEDGLQLRAGEKPEGPPIYSAIDRVDRLGMEIVESGDYNAYIEYLETTGNTICGRHPIGIVMCALESLKIAQKLNSRSSNFKFLHYERSSQCRKISDSSVSYASAFAVVDCGEERTTPNTSSALTSLDPSSS